MTDRTTGIVKWYDEVKGYGFIAQDGQKDIFVHRNGISTNSQTLFEGQKVSFEIVDGHKGPQAQDVTDA